MVRREGGFSRGIAAGLSRGQAGKGSRFCGKSRHLRLLAKKLYQSSAFFFNETLLTLTVSGQR